MAWTKPLIAQQAENIVHDAGLDFNEHCVLTSQYKSKTTPTKRGNNAGTVSREQLWKTKKLFCAIPQCVAHDIENGLVDLDRVRLVIVDEAHRALGKE